MIKSKIYQYPNRDVKRSWIVLEFAQPNTPKRVPIQWAQCIICHHMLKINLLSQKTIHPHCRKHLILTMNNISHNATNKTGTRK